MSITIHQIATPIFFQMLPALSVNLGKAEEYAKARKFEPEALLKARLYPDMYPLDRQVQTACDHAARAMARLAGIEVPSFPDTETTFDELRQRIDKALAYVKSVTPEKLAGCEDRPMKIVFPWRTLDYANGLEYLTSFALPHFYFHVSAAHAILRHNGLEIGKRDYMGRT